MPHLTAADPGLMKGGFSGDRRNLAMGVLTMENAAVACEARHLGGSGGMLPREILDLLRLFLVQSGSNRDRYSLGIYLNRDGAAVSASVRDVREK